MAKRRKAAAEYADEPWFKLARRIFRSSIWEEDPATRIVWITLLHLAQLPENRTHGRGVVLITRGNLCREAFVTAEQLDHSLLRLTTPDPTSRTEPGEGRIEILPNGFRIRSFDRYHNAKEFEAWHAQRVAAGKARAVRARRSQSASGRGGRGRFASEKPATAGSRTSDRWFHTSKTERETMTDTEREIETDGRTEPSAPSHSLERRPQVTEATAATIMTVAEDLSSLVKGEKTPGGWIRQASRIEASNGRGPRSFEDPRQPGISEAWGQATLSRLREEQARVRDAVRIP